MAKCDVVDTFPAFLAFWDEMRRESLDAQVEAWAAEYMSQWPELLEKQQQDYAGQDVDWRQVGREKVFPFLAERLPAMKVAHENLLEVCETIYSTAQEALPFDGGVVFVIYVGIGCGAGWGTRFHNSPAVLFGLENIAACGWSERQAITGLVAHEIGHLVHDHWRAQYEKPVGSGPWWQLYSEGFAQRCEHVILGQETWHMAIGVGDDDWLDWCRNQKGWLAGEFLRVVYAGEPVRPFFGSWFDVRGRKQCGYFLGHEAVKELQAGASIKDIALMDDAERRLRPILEKFAQGEEKATISLSCSS